MTERKKAPFPKGTIFLIKEYKQAIQLHKQGLYAREISEKLLCSEPSVRNWLRKEGLEPHRHPYAEKRKSKNEQALHLPKA